MKKSYPKNVDVFVVLFLLLTLLISSLASAANDSAEMKVKLVFEQIESSLFSLNSKMGLLK
mgnify:CR=1 FL=1